MILKYTASFMPAQTNATNTLWKQYPHWVSCLCCEWRVEGSSNLYTTKSLIYAPRQSENCLLLLSLCPLPHLYLHLSRVPVPPLWFSCLTSLNPLISKSSLLLFARSQTVLCWSRCLHFHSSSSFSLEADVMDWDSRKIKEGYLSVSRIDKDSLSEEQNRQNRNERRQMTADCSVLSEIKHQIMRVFQESLKKVYRVLPL